MSAISQPNPPGYELFNHNRTTQPPELLLPYTNQYVAWRADGTQILASAPTWDEVESKLCDLGINPNQVVFEFVPDPNVSYF